MTAKLHDPFAVQTAVSTAAAPDASQKATKETNTPLQIVKQSTDKPFLRETAANRDAHPTLRCAALARLRALQKLGRANR